MLFNSLEFAFFLPVVFALYWLIPSKQFKWQNTLLILSSYFFYGWWDWRFLLLIFISSFTDYVIGLLMAKSDDERQRKLWLWVSIGVNISLLGFFKYYNFFVSSFAESFTLLGFRVEERTLNIILPIGISFYTFQTLSYSIDLYRKKIKACYDPVAFFAFVSFFPQLVIGPIERAYRMLPQFENPRVFNSQLARDGLRQMLWGLFKKVVIADTLNRYVDAIFNSHDELAGIVLFTGIILFAFQVYADFSGYSDMAIGMARFFGFNLARNFHFPFFSRDFIEFWQRWHISLSTWFRDYVFIPLGGSRVSTFRMTLNVLITFGISGIWHGASGNMLVWGLTCGVLYAITRFSGLYEKARIVSDPHPQLHFVQIGQMLLTFLMFAIPLVLVRSQSWGEAASYYQSLFTNNFWGMPMGMTVWLPWILILVIVEWVHRKKEHGLDISGLPVIGRWLIYFLVLNAILLFGVFTKKEFFYFQF